MSCESRLAELRRRLAHDARSPVAEIVGVAELLLLESGDGHFEDLERDLRQILQSARGLLADLDALHAIAAGEQAEETARDDAARGSEASESMAIWSLS